VPPPPRRRPVPSTPAYRPRVAGLHKNPPTAPPVDQDAPAAPNDGEATADRSDTRGQTLADVAAIDSSAQVTTPDEVSPDPVEPTTGTATESDTGTTEKPTSKPVGRKRTSTRVPSPTLRKPSADPDSADPAADPADDTADDTDAEPARTRSPLLLPLVLVLVAAVLACLGFWFQTRSRDVRFNEALVDTGGTTEVNGQAREAVEKAFSYNFADVTATEKAANELLVGKAKCQYNAIFGPVKTLAPEQKLVVTVRVVSSGVTSLDGDRATVLLFIDQVTTRTTDNQTGGGIAMMRVGAQRSDGRWKIDNMEMFGQTGDQSAGMEKCADAK
jgi:Mce-associated membrane protein